MRVIRARPVNVSGSDASEASAASLAIRIVPPSAQAAGDGRPCRMIM